jgi:hypothetical protein
MSTPLARAAALGAALFMGISENRAHGQDYSQFARCNETKKQVAQAGEALKRPDREKLLYDLYIDLMALFKERSHSNASIPKSLRDSCIQNKWKAYMSALDNADKTFASNMKIRWQTAELQEASGELDAALKLYAEAAKMEPENAELQMKYFKIWDSQKRKTLNLQNQEINTEEIRRFVDESETQLKRIQSIRDGSREIRIEATQVLCELYSELSAVFRSSEKLVACFENLLSLDPSQQKALRALANFYLKKGLKSQAAPYLSRLANLGVASQSDRNVTAGVLAEQRNFPELLKFAEAELMKSPHDKDALENKAIALQGLDRKIELLETVKLLRKVNPQSAIIKEIDALKLVGNGDDYLSQGLPSNALAAYQQATRLLGPESHNLYRIQTKIALLIFDHHKSQNFENKDVVAIDMKEVVKLLSPVLKEKTADPEILRTSTKAAYLASNYEIGEQFCERLFNEFPSLNNKSELLDCADIYIAVGKRAKAAMLFDLCARKPQYQRTEIEAEKRRRHL